VTSAARGPRRRPLRLLGPAGQPLYEQTHEALAELVAAGTYRPGSRLPSERMLCQALGISRLTLRRALESLVALGIIERRQARGWYVPEGPVTGGTNELMSFARMALARGLEPTARILAATVRPATLDESEVLRMAPGAAIHDLERLRMMDGVPIGVDRSRIPLARAPWLTETDFAVSSLHVALEAHGLVPTMAEYTIGVADADSRLGGLLEVPAGRGLLEVGGVTFDQRGVPFELGWAVYRPDRYRMQTTLARSRVRPLFDDARPQGVKP
jgi:DNA-binding GntR family transcriptional regulator